MYRVADRGNRRPAITLVELLVVMGIITALGVIGAIGMSHWQEDKRTSGAVERLSQWLLTAKSRAKSDARPTGLRFLAVADASGTITAREFQYIQEPEDVTGALVPSNPSLDRRCVSIVNQDAMGMSIPSVSPIGPGVPVSLVSFQNVNFIGGAQIGNTADYLVQPGDYLEIQGGGSVHRVYWVRDAFTLELSNPGVTFNVPGGTANFRIYRGPRPLAGEEKVTLTDGMQVVVSRPSGSTSVGLNPRVVSGTQQHFEIMFSPGGELIGQANGGGQIILWVEDTEADPGDLNAISLIAIKGRTGFISSHPVGPPANPYAFTQDGQSSGI